jgi:membrane protein YqaA with SNARE-associated domain
MTFTEIFTQWAVSTIDTWGYIGIFFASMVGSATVILPVPVFLLIFSMGAVLNPLLVGIFAGIGSGLGEITGYGVGYGSRKLVKEKWKKQIKRTERWLERHGAFFIIIIFAATPLPHDLVGIVCGSIKYPVRKFVIATTIGKVIRSVLIAYAGFYSLHWVLGYLGW